MNTNSGDIFNITPNDEDETVNTDLPSLGMGESTPISENEHENANNEKITSQKSVLYGIADHKVLFQRLLMAIMPVKFAEVIGLEVGLHTAKLTLLDVSHL